MGSKQCDVDFHGLGRNWKRVGQRWVSYFSLIKFSKTYTRSYLFSFTAFHHAAVGGKPDSLKLLSAAGVNENALDNKGKTALTTAIARKKVESVRALLELNVDTSKATTKRDTPAEIVALLEQHKQRSVSPVLHDI